MWQALLWGGFAGASVFIGEALAGPLARRPHVTGLVMGFGAGALLSAVGYELIPPGNLAKGLGLGIGVAFLLGALVYFLADHLTDGAGGGERSKIASNKMAASAEGSGFAMFLGTLLDGIPESFVLGVTLAVGGSVSVAFVAAVFISNIPEAAAGTLSLKGVGLSDGRISLIWGGLVLVSAISATVGFWIASSFQVEGLYAQAFAAGAVLTMLADSMMPEAFRHGGTWVGVLTVFGYLVAAVLSVEG